MLYVHARGTHTSEHLIFKALFGKCNIMNSIKLELMVKIIIYV